MTLPKILHDNIFALGVSATDTDSDSQYSVDNIYDLRTYTYWLGASAGVKYFTMDAGAAVDVDSLRIISHNLGTAEASVAIESSTTGAWAGEEVNRYNPELVTNGDFPSSTTGWTANDSAVLTIDTARLKVTNGAAVAGNASQGITTVSGVEHIATVDFTKGTATGGQLRIGTTSGGNEIDDAASTSTTLLSIAFIATGITYISLKVNDATNGVNAIFDNASVRLAETADTAIAKTFTSYSAQYSRVRIATASVIPRVGICLLGEALEFPKKVAPPYDPVPTSVVSNTSKTKAGSILGTIVDHKPINIRARFRNIDWSFVNGDYKTFWDDHGSEGKPFFWSADSDTYDTYFVKLSPKSKFSGSMTIEGRVDVLTLDMEGVAE